MSQNAIRPEVQAYIHEATMLISKSTVVAVGKAVANGYHDEPDYRIAQPFLLVHGDHDLKPIQQGSAA